MHASWNVLISDFEHNLIRYANDNLKIRDNLTIYAETFKLIVLNCTNQHILSLHAVLMFVLLLLSASSLDAFVTGLRSRFRDSSAKLAFRPNNVLLAMECLQAFLIKWKALKSSQKDTPDLYWSLLRYQCS